MPIYEYECKDCDNEFEVFKSITDNNGSKCPKCSSGNTNRLISSAGFILKGSGWYVNDYPSESRKKGMEADKKAATSGESSASTSKETKSDTASKPASTDTSSKPAA